MSQIAHYQGAAGSLEAISPASAPSAHDLGRLYHAVAKRWRLFLAVAGGFVLLVTIVTMLMPKTYTTTVRLLAGRQGTEVAPNGNDTSLPVLNALVLQSGEQSAETLAELAQQHGIAQDVIGKLNLQTTPEALLQRVSVTPVVKTNLLDLKVGWKSSEDSARIANAFADAFVNQERDFVRSQATAAIAFLSGELPKAQAQAQKTASDLARFQAAHGYVDATVHQQDIVSRVASLDQRIDQLSVDSSEAAALLSSVSAQMAALPSTVDSAKEVARNPVSADLLAKLADVETQLVEAEDKYTPRHPAVIALRQQRDALKAQIAGQPSAVISQTTVARNPLYDTLSQQAATYRARIEGDRGQLRALKAERAAYRPAIRQGPQQAVQFGIVAEQAKRAANVYNALEQKYNDALVASSTAISDISIVQAANADDAVKRPRLVTNVAISVVMGLLLGLALVYALDLLDRRTADRDFAALLGLPVIARIPALDGDTEGRLTPWVASMQMEAFLQLCVTLGLRGKRPAKTLAILSARRGEGKSTIAYHFAKAMATLQPGILLIDADMRQPTLHEKAGCSNSVGLAEVLNE